MLRELYINGVYSKLYGIDWNTMEVIYRQAIDGKPVYVRVSMKQWR